MYAGRMAGKRHPAETPERDPLTLEDQVCFALSVAARGIVGVYRPVLEPLGVTHPQYLVMLALWEHGEVSVKELSALLQLEPATVSPLVKRLETIGYVSRRRSLSDERLLLVATTDRGQALRAKAEQVPLEVVHRLGIGLDELEGLNTVLRRVIAAATAART
jgi:MarR family transcriptional regulator, organic hydroperoxide resistance regulator